MPPSSSKLIRIDTDIANLRIEAASDDPPTKRTKMTQEILIGFTLNEYGHVRETTATVMSFHRALCDPHSDSFENTLLFHCLNPIHELLKDSVAVRFFERWRNQVPEIGAIMLEPFHNVLTDLYNMAKNDGPDLDQNLPPTFDLDILPIMQNARIQLVYMQTAFRTNRLTDNFGAVVPQFIRELSSHSRNQESDCRRLSNRPPQQEQQQLRADHPPRRGEDQRVHPPRRGADHRDRSADHRDRNNRNGTSPYSLDPRAPGMITCSGDFTDMPNPRVGKAARPDGSMACPCKAYITKGVRCNFTSETCRFVHVNNKEEVTEDQAGFIAYVENTACLSWTIRGRRH